MAELHHRQIKLSKLHTQPKKGYRLGTASAAWKKIKSATTAPGTRKVEDCDENHNKQIKIDVEQEEVAVDETNGVAGNTVCNVESDSVLRDYGSGGEIVTLYTKSKVIEVWGWLPPCKDSKFDGDTLYLIYQTKLGPTKSPIIKCFKIIKQLNDSFKIAIVTLDAIEIHLLEPKRDSSTPLSCFHVACPISNDRKYFIKNSERYLLVSSDDGYVHIIEKNDKGSFGGAPHKLHSIRKSSSQPIIDSEGLQTSDYYITLKTSCNEDGKPIFDLVDNWLVYCPTKIEYKYLRAINKTKIDNSKKQPLEEIDPIVTNLNRLYDEKEHQLNKNSLFTPVRLPPSGKLLKRVLSTFSNTALDGLFKLSEMSSSKVKSYLDHDKKIANTNSGDITFNSIGKAVGKLLYSTASTTANTVQNSTRSFKPNNNQIIKILDLSNDKILGVFKPPGGVSNLSLSPYDLQLVNSNVRGDSLFLWDLYRLPTEISLMGKFARGKTSAIVENIFWFSNSHEERLTAPNSLKPRHKSTFINSGFGCITKSTGSVHWFNTNYLSGDNMGYTNHNFKNESTGKSVGFLESWILPSFGAREFVILPMTSNTDRLASFEFKSDLYKSSRIMNQLAIKDNNNQLKLISTLNGHHFYKYDLPGKPSVVTGSNYEKFNKSLESEEESINPLSQAEIETSAPFSNLINNTNIVFETYDFGGKDDHDCFFNLFKDFGNSIPGKIVQIDSSSVITDKELKDETGEIYSGIKGLYLDQEDGFNA